jgi:hypothetical protein
MKNSLSDLELHRIAHDDLQRLAREELGRSLTGAEIHAMQEQLREGMHAADALAQHLQRSLS